MTQRLPASVQFDAVAAELAAMRTRPEIAVRANPGPTKLAPFALALNATVAVADTEIADGRLVVLHDPAGQESWNGTWRVVLFASAELEDGMADDPVMTDMGWSWLEEALGERDLAVGSFGGTVTRTASKSYGVLGDRGPTGELEIRASWTPAVEAPHPRLPSPDPAVVIREHVSAWLDLLALITALDAQTEGVAPLRSRS